MSAELRNKPNAAFSLKRLMIYLLVIAFVSYFGLMVFALLFAEQVIFQPRPASYKDDSSILKLETANLEKISAKYFQNENAEYTILFSHGNAEDIGDNFYFEELRNAGFSVFAYDYRGYGTSDGTASEENAYEDIEAAYNYLVSDLNIQPEKIIVHGRSLGGAVSVDLASKKQCGGLIIESSFVSAFRVLTKYPVFPFDKFKSISKIKDVQCPVLIIHGKKDSLIAFWHGESLFAQANELKNHLWVDEANHNDLFAISKTDYLRAIQEFSEKLPK